MLRLAVTLPGYQVDTALVTLLGATAVDDLHQQYLLTAYLGHSLSIFSQDLVSMTRLFALRVCRLSHLVPDTH